MATKHINRREFLISTATVAGVAFPALSWSAARPCPPPSLSVEGGTTRTTVCTRPVVERFPKLTLNSLAATGTYPWTFGQAFSRGAVAPASLSAVSGASSFQADVRNIWDDGSVKYAVLSGVSSFNAGTVDIVLGDSGVRTAGANVGERSAAWLADNIVVRLTGQGSGTYTPAAARNNGSIKWDRTKPHKVREVLGPVMSEFHYYSPTSDDHLAIWWYVRAYSDGSVEVETVFENGWLNLPEPSHKKYGVAVVIGGRERYSTSMIGVPFWHSPQRLGDKQIQFKGASVRGDFLPGETVRFLDAFEKAYTVISAEWISGSTVVTVDSTLPETLSDVQIDGHLNHSRWSRIDWVEADPGVTPGHDGDYLMAAGFSPNYYKGDGPPSESTLNSLRQPAAPFEQGAWPTLMGSVGSNAELLNKWEVFYIKTNGDIRAYRSTIAHAIAAGRYGIYYRDETTGAPALYSSYPDHAFDSSGSIQTLTVAARSPTFPAAGPVPPNYAKTHAAQYGYMPYLLTGRHSFREQAEFQAQVSHWAVNMDYGSFEGARVALGGLTAFAPRGAGWAIRTMMAAVMCVPDGDPRAQQYRTQLGKTLAYYDTHFTDTNAFGLIQPNQSYTQKGEGMHTASFQQDYFSMACAWSYQIATHVLGEDRPRAERFIKWRMRHVVGRMGNQSGFCYRDAATYTLKYSDENLSNVRDHSPAEFNASLYPDWTTLYEKTFGVANTCSDGTELRGESGAHPSELTRNSNSYWALTQATLAFAVDLGTPGAKESWLRLVNAPNWDPNGFRNLPDWGIVPRS